MKSPKHKRKPNPPRKCIFCGGSPISREHILAEWMKEYLPEDLSGTTHMVSTAKRTSTGLKLPPIPNEPGALNLPGDHRSRKVKTVCERCNNNWMSEIQNIAKPIIIPLLTGNFLLNDSYRQKIVSTWSIIYTMVWESAHPESLATPQQHRDFIRLNKSPPPNWMVWVGKLDTSERFGPFTLHRGFRISNPTDQEIIRNQEGINIKCNTQITIITFGGAILVTFYTSDDAFFNTAGKNLGMCIQNIGLLRIWPVNPLMLLHANPDKLISPYQLVPMINEFTNVLRVS